MKENTKVVVDGCMELTTEQNVRDSAHAYHFKPCPMTRPTLCDANGTVALCRIAP